MKKPIEINQLFYEIAMSIGLTLDMNKMLKVGLTSYLKNLHCSAGAILHIRKKGRYNYLFRKIYAIPRNIQKDPLFNMAMSKLSPSYDEESLNKYRTRLPLTGGNARSGYYHILDLPGFGLIILLRPEGELDNLIIKAINPLNAKMAVACNACLQNRELNKAHRKELKINKELRAKTRALENSQKALYDSERKYRTIFKNVQDVFFQIDLDGVILEISPSISRFSDSNREKLLNQRISTIYANASDHLRLLKIIKEKYEVEDFELRLNDRHGREMHTSVNAHMVFDSNGNPFAIEGSMRDVSVRKRAEEALRESDRMKSDFVSSVSHELRTPLASILGFSSTILRDQKMDNRTKEEFIKIIYQESQRLSKLIEDILNISRIESGRMTYKMHLIAFNPIVSEILEVHRIQAQEKKILLTSDFSDDTNEIFADPDAMKQVLSNLFGNAIKFTPEGGKINVRVYQDATNVVFELNDTGIGIAPNELGNIFSKFYRVHRPGLEVQGTGLGLSIVKEILDTHNIKIEVSSKENQGTKFTLIFPQEPDYRDDEE